MTDYTNAMKLIRESWYEENNKSTKDMNPRELAIHVGTKIGLMRALNLLSMKQGENELSHK